jgi:hypothetical protein
MFESLSSSGVVAAALIAPPGPEVMAALGAVSLSSLSPEQEVDVLVAWERQAAWVAAQVQPVMARVGDLAEAAAGDVPHRAELTGRPQACELPARAAHAEVAAALRLSEVTAANRLEVARGLSRRLPMVQAALAAGDISFWHANAIVESTYALTEDQASAVAVRVPGRARRQTVAQLRRSLRRAVLAIDPTSAAERHAKAKAQRSVDFRPLDDGMAELAVTAPAADLLRLFQTVDAVARALPKVGSDGVFMPIGARRVDALVGLVTADPAQPRRTPAVSVQVTVDLATLLGLQDSPGELAGYGPIPASVARALAADASWRRLVCDPLSGGLLDLGRSSYVPNAELARFVRSRDPQCSFPGCCQPAYVCDLDHCEPYSAGGRTDRKNLRPLCRAHHRLKHEGGWNLYCDPVTGHTSWKSLLGHRYPVATTDLRPEEAYQDPPLPDEMLTWLQKEVAAAEMAAAKAASADGAAAPAEELEECPF